MSNTNRENGRYIMGFGFGIAVGSGFKAWPVIFGIALMAIGAWLQGKK